MCDTKFVVSFQIIDNPLLDMPGLPNRNSVPPPNVTMGHHSMPMMMARQQTNVGGSWNSNNNNNNNCLSWGSVAGSAPRRAVSSVAPEVPVRQNYDVIARRRNPHYWMTPNSSGSNASSSNSNGHSSSSSTVSSALPLMNQNAFIATSTNNCNNLSPLTPTPTPSPATPSPISPAYPNRPISVVFSVPLIRLALICLLWNEFQVIRKCWNDDG